MGQIKIYKITILPLILLVGVIIPPFLLKFYSHNSLEIAQDNGSSYLVPPPK